METEPECELFSASMTGSGTQCVLCTTGSSPFCSDPRADTGMTLWLSSRLDECYKNPASSQKEEKECTVKKNKIKFYALPTLTSVRTETAQ